MNINTNSWHYRLIGYTGLYPSSNLCPYVRTVCLAIIMVIMGIALGGLLLMVALLMLAAPYISWVYGYDPDQAGILMLLWILVGVVTILQYREGKPLDIDVTVFERDPLKEPSLFRQWLKAKHDKICPHLTFSREDN